MNYLLVIMGLFILFLMEVLRHLKHRVDSLEENQGRLLSIVETHQNILGIKK